MSSTRSAGKSPAASNRAPGSGQPQNAHPLGVTLPVMLQLLHTLPRRRNWERTLGSSQQSSRAGCSRSSAALELRPSVSRSNAAASAHPRQTRVRTRGVPSAATVASCSQRAAGERPSRSRAPRSSYRLGGSVLTWPAPGGGPGQWSQRRWQSTQGRR